MQKKILNFWGKFTYAWKLNIKYACLFYNQVSESCISTNSEED